jgi:hypothetical protein
MKIVKPLFALLIVFSTNVCALSQNNTSVTISKIKKFLYSYAVTPHSNETGKTIPVYYNKVDKIIDIAGSRIPLSDVKISYYFYKETESKHYVSFDCKNKSKCIVGGEDENEVIALMLPFKTKENCYKLIELINELR